MDIEKIDSYSFRTLGLKKLIRNYWELAEVQINSLPTLTQRNAKKRERISYIAKLVVMFPEDRKVISELLTGRKGRQVDRTIKDGMFSREKNMKKKTGSISSLNHSTRSNENCAHCPKNAEDVDGIPNTVFKSSSSGLIPLSDEDSTPSTQKELDDKESSLLSENKKILQLSEAKSVKEVLDYFGYDGSNESNVRTMMKTVMMSMGINVSANVTRPETLARKLYNYLLEKRREMKAEEDHRKQVNQAILDNDKLK